MTLFCAPDTYALSAHVLLEELGVPYDLEWVELFSNRPDPAFLAASPHCRTPALATPEGSIFETGAVCLYLAERDPEARFLIPSGDPRRGTFLQWFHYLATSLQPDVIIQFHPEFYQDGTAEQNRLKAHSMKRLRTVFETLDAALDHGPYFFGDHPTVPDFILGMQTIWDVIFPDGDITAYPNIARHRDALCARPAAQRVLEQHRAQARKGALST